jgi:signal peptidase I
MYALMTIAIMLVTTMAQAPTIYQRGEIVRVKGKSEIPSVRIIAVPGDRVRIDDSGVYVNDGAVTSISAEFLLKLPKPWQPERIADGQYFVLGSQRAESNGTLTKGDYWAYIGGDALEKIRP